MRVLAVITARGGSKGIPRKNIKLLAGRPLLAYTADAALASKSLTDIVLSTDDEEIAAVGRSCGLQVPFLRPAELARDETPSLPVVQHAVSWLEQQGHQYDAVCLLEPTSPTRRAWQIDACVEMFAQRQADAVVSVLPIPPKYNPYWAFLNTDDGMLRLSTGANQPIPQRQQLPEAYHRDGSVYVTRRDVLMLQNSMYGKRLFGFPLDPEMSVDIDTLADWERADRLLRESGKFPFTEHAPACRVP